MRKHYLTLILISYVSFCGGNDGYIISGKISGLDGELVLQNNGKDDLKIEKDGTFVFKTKLAGGEKFNVSAYREPCLQRCSIKDGQGAIKNNDVEDVEINCLVKQWDAAEQFLKGTDFENEDISVWDTAMDLDGDMIILWSLKTNNKHFYKSEFRDGTWFHPKPEDFFGIAELEIKWPTIEMNDNGEAIIAWKQDDGFGNSSIYKSEYFFGVWNKPELLSDHINSLGTGGALIDVAINNLGDIIIVWTNSNLNQSDIPGVYKRERYQGVWSEIPTANDRLNVGDSNPAFPKVVMNNHGDAVIAWVQSDGTTDNLYKSEYYNHEWHNPASIDDHLNAIGKRVPLQINLKINNVGDVLFFWNEPAYTDPSDLVIAERYQEIWSKKMLDTGSDFYINESTSFYSLAKNIGLADNGDAIISWQNDGKIYTAERRDRTWKIVTQDRIQNRPTVLMDEKGNANLTWTSRSRPNFELYSKQYLNEYWYPLTKVATVEDMSNYSVNAPVASMKECKEYVLWQTNIGDKTIFHFNRYY